MKGLVVAITKNAVLELVSGARTFCDQVVLAVPGKEELALCADKAYVLAYTGSRISCGSALADIIEAEQPDMVLVEQNIDGRYFAACAAAQLKTSVLADCLELAAEDGAFLSRRMTYGGSALKTERAPGKVVACVGGGVFEPAQEAPCTAVETVQCGADSGIVTVAERSKEVRRVNLTAAKKVVGVGRGIGSQENLRLAQELADTIGAEMACTRPIAEEEKWMGKERYVGVSGAMLKPTLYIALGISGQIQHTVGVNGSGVIISVNKDKNAPMFQQSDYGLVGDVTEVLPKLIEMLK